MSWLKDARVEQNLTQDTVAQLLGITRPTYASLEADPNRLTVRQIMTLSQVNMRIELQDLTPISCPACGGSGLLYKNKEK